MPYVPREELTRRLDELRRRLADDGLDGALLHGTTSLLYFAGTAQQAHLWVPAQGEPVLLVRRVLERARAESALSDVRALGSLRTLPDFVGESARVGMELDILPVSLFRRYERALPGVRELTDIGPATRVIRARKSDLEVERIRAAAEAADAAFSAVAENLREGMSELELSVVVESSERRHGFQGMIRWRAATGFECPWAHVLAGDSALAFSFADTPFGGEGITPAAPYGASHRLIARGAPVCVDFALARDGYIHDATRTFSVGPLPGELQEAYEVACAMHRMIEREALPGATGAHLWERCVEIAAEAGLDDRFMGYGEQRVSFVGHGVGLELDELPVLAPRQDLPLEDGHVIAVEPKFFFPGVGAVGLENTYVVRPGGSENLTVTSEDLVVV